MPRSTIPILLALLLPPGAQAQAPTDSAAVVATIRTTLLRWAEAATAQDHETTMAVWARDLIGWYPGQPDDTYEREAAAAAHPADPTRRSRTQVTVNEVMVSGRMAVVRDTWVITQWKPSGDSTVLKIRGFEVWQPQADGVWRIARWISAPEPT